MRSAALKLAALKLAAMNWSGACQRRSSDDPQFTVFQGQLVLQTSLRNNLRPSGNNMIAANGAPRRKRPCRKTRCRKTRPRKTQGKRKANAR